MSKLAFRFALLTGLIMLASALVAGPASAARPCTLPGYKVASRDATNIVLRKDVSKKYWEDDAWAYAVCSRTWGRAIKIGESGITPDGPVWSDLRAMNSRYAAVVTGYGGNADGGSDTGIFVVDLRSGKRISSGSPSLSGAVEEEGVFAVALSPTGAVGWIDGAVNVRYPDGRTKHFDSVPTLNLSFLRWSDDGERLLWAESTTQVAYEHPKYEQPKPNKRGACLRQGDRLVGRDENSVYVTRPTQTRGWTNARSLIACSYEFRKRVTIARSGVREGTTFAFRMPEVTSGTAVVVTTRKSALGPMSPLITAYDLGSARRICITELAPGIENPKLGRVEAFGETMFWNVSDKAGTQLRVCDVRGARALFTSPNLEPQFLDFNPQGVLVVVDEKSGA